MSAQRLFGAGAIVLISMGAMAQTHTEMLEKGIFTEETAGDLAGAIRIYETLSTESGVPADIALRARARLVEARRKQQQTSPVGSTSTATTAPDGAGMRAKGVMELLRAVQAATADRQTPSEAVAAQTQAVNGCCGLFSGNYDPGRVVNVNGTVTRVELINPQSVVYVNGDDGKSWGFTLAAPNTMIGGGWNRNTLKIGDQVSVSGYLAKGTGDCESPLPHACATLQRGALHASASTITANGQTVFDRFTLEMQQLKLLQERERQELERPTVRPAQ